MSFRDIPFRLKALNLTRTGLEVTKSAPMTLQVAAGTLTDTKTGATYTLAAPATHEYASDPETALELCLRLVTNGAALEVDGCTWERGVSDKTANANANEILELAWGEIAVGEMDLDNITLTRRVWE